MKLTTHPLTPDLWPAFEDLFGENGAVGACSSTYPFRRPLPRWGRYGLMLHFLPRRLQYLRGYFKSPEAKSAAPQNRERPALGCCLSSSIQLDFW